MANTSVVTYPGRTIIWTRVRGAGTEPLNIGWGIGSVTNSSISDVNLFIPATETRVAGTSTVITSASGQLGDTYQVTGTLTCSTAGKTITEAGLYDTTTLSQKTTTTSSISTTGLTSFTLTAALNPPATGNYYIQVENEAMLVTGGQNTTIVTVTRNVLGSSAATHAVGVTVTVGGDGGASAFSLGGQTATVNAAAGGNMFAHADFTGIALSVNDSILFTWKDTLT